MHLVDRLKAVLAELSALGTLIQEQASNMPLKDEVEVGQALWRIGNTAKRLVAPVKQSLVEEAEKRARTPGAQFLHGRTRTSRCTVTIPEPQVKLGEGLSWDDVRGALGPEALTFFNVHVTPRPDFHSQVAKASPETLLKLVALTDAATPPPRITFQD